MIEVHAANRPGRPTLLVILTAGVLAGSLGLAWTQVHVARALGPRSLMPGTPLSIAPPRDWTPNKSLPGLYEKLVQIDRGPWGQRVATEQQLRFGYARLPVPQPPLHALQYLGMVRSTESVQVARSTIAGLPGIEVRIGSVEVVGGRRITRVRMIRAATLPRGDLVFMDYRPYLGVTLGDLTMLDDVAAAMRIEDPSANVSAQAAAQRAAVSLPVDNGWRFDLPRLAETPGLHVGPSDGSGAWALAIHRTFVSAERRPADLLADAVGDITELDPFDIEIRQSAGGGDTERARAVIPQHGRHAYSLVAAGLVHRAGEAAFVLAYADQNDATAARGVFDRTMDGLQFSAPLFAGQSEQISAGKGIAEWMAQGGAVRAWGGRVFQAVYVFEFFGDDYRIEVTRRPAPASRGAGYEGQERTLIGSEVSTRWEWSVAAAGLPCSTTVQRAAAPDVPQLWFREVIPPGGPGMRQRAGTFRKQWEFELPGTYIPGPLLELVASKIAREGGEAQVSTSHLLGRGANFVLIRSLPRQDGAARAVILHDYSPLAEILTFDDENEVSAMAGERHAYRRAR